jgi:hypothetical protein
MLGPRYSLGGESVYIIGPGFDSKQERKLVLITTDIASILCKTMLSCGTFLVAFVVLAHILFSAAECWVEFGND